MISDPSDGSVRAKPSDLLTGGPLRENLLNSRATAAPTATGKESLQVPILDTSTSGLPSASARDAERRERDRKWLADYRAGKINPKPEGE